MKIKNGMKRAVSLLLCATMLLTSETVFGLGGSPGGGSFVSTSPASRPNSNSAGSSIYRVYPWTRYSSYANTGFRFYLVDNQQNLVSSVFDYILGSGARGDVGYTSTYREELSTDASNYTARVADSYAQVPLAVLMRNPMYGYHETDSVNHTGYVDNVKYLSTVCAPDADYNGVHSADGNGIIAFVMEGLTNTGDEVRNRLISAVQNGNSDANGNNTQGTTARSNVTVIVNTGNSNVDGLIVNANNALNHQSASECRHVLSQILGVYDGAALLSGGDSTVRTACSTATRLARQCSSVASLTAVQNRYHTGLKSTELKKKAYNWLISQGYSATDAFIAVTNAKATKSGKIGNVTLILGKEDSIDLDQIIPTAPQESTDTTAIDELLEDYITFGDQTIQSYVDTTRYKPTDLMAMENYVLVVEPVMWFRWSNNTYSEAEIGFKCEVSGEVTTAHQDATQGGWYRNSAPVEPNSEGSTYIEGQPHVDEVVNITYKWKYADDSGNEQEVDVVKTVREGADYSYGGSESWRAAINKADNLPFDFTYDGNSVSWSQSSRLHGNYNGYNEWHAYCSNSNYREDSTWTYGSLRDAIHYCARKGEAPNSQLAELIEVYLPAAMVVRDDMEFDGGLVHGTAEDSYSISGKDLGWLSSNSADYGYGMHMYRADGFFTKTRDDVSSTPGEEHKAPRPEDPSKYTDKTGEIQIVKTYRVKDANGNVVSEKTYIRWNEPSVAYILQEKDWNLTDWYISNKSSQLKDASGADNAQAKWDEMKAEVYGNKSSDHSSFRDEGTGELLGRSHSGFPDEYGVDGWTDNNTIPASDGNCKVTLDGTVENKSTLYVLFEKTVNTEEGHGEVDLTESELYDVTSTDGSISELRFPGWPSTLKVADDTFRDNGSTTDYMIARGEDKVTFKQFTGNMSAFDTSKGQDTSNVMDNWYYGAEGGTASINGSYTAEYKMYPKSTDNEEANEEYDGQAVNTLGEIIKELTVAVYHGKRVVDPNDLTDASDENVYHTRVKSATLTDIVPYYWMTVSDLDGNKNIRYMACESNNKRSMNAYDYAEVTFESQGSIEVSSSMWATDKSITSQVGTDALKGGASLQISTPDYAKVKATTYCTVMDDYVDGGDNLIASITLSDPSEEISSVAAVERHESFVDQLSTDLQDDWEITQYVSKGTNNELPAGSNDDGEAPSTSIKVYGGANISALGNGSSNASSQSKYYLESGRGDLATSAIMETKVDQTQSKYVRVFTLPNGNVYYVTGNSYNECDSNMMSMMNSVASGYDNGSYTGYQSAGNNIVCYKGAYDNILCSSDIKDAIVKSGALKTLVNSVELNTGDDNSAPWTGGEDNKWYNEGAWITVLAQSTTIEIGIINVKSRILVLDPKLTPKQGKKSNSVSFNTSAFRADWVAGEDTSIGTFRDQSIVGNTDDFKKMFKVSNTFYIPNRTVTDNK